MTTAIQEYDATEAALSELRDKFGATVWVVDTPDRMASAKQARGEIRTIRLDLEEERKRIKKPALERCREIDGEAKRITTELFALEQPVDHAIKEVEQAAKREEERIKREEEERLAKARAEVDRIRNVPVDLVGADIDAIQEAAGNLKSLDLSGLAGMSGVAKSARDEAVAKLRSMYADAKLREDEQAVLRAERAELDKRRAEQAERDRIDREAREADERERRAKLEADERASRERIAEDGRKAREARDKADSEALEALEAEETRLRVEKEKIDKAKRTQEDAERREERERNMMIDAREMLKVFRHRFGHVDEFEAIIQAIDEYLAEAAA